MRLLARLDDREHLYAHADVRLTYRQRRNHPLESTDSSGREHMKNGGLRSGSLGQ